MARMALNEVIGVLAKPLTKITKLIKPPLSLIHHIEARDVDAEIIEVFVEEDIKVDSLPGVDIGQLRSFGRGDPKLCNLPAE
jgi:hypothetical protein